MIPRLVWAAMLLGTSVFAGTDGGVFVPAETIGEALADGNAAFERGELAAARRGYEAVLRLDPSNLAALVNLGQIEIREKNPRRAQELLERAVSLRIDTAPAWLALGTIHMDADRFDAALAALSQAVLREPSNPRARNFLGVVIGRRGWIDGAREELRRAVELDPGYADAHYNLAVFYLQEKPPAVELARRHYFKALELGVEKDPEMEKVFRQPPKTP